MRALLFLLALAALGCTRELPAPNTPTPAAPEDLELTEREKRVLDRNDVNLGMVIITTDVPARVERVIGTKSDYVAASRYSWKWRRVGGPARSYEYTQQSFKTELLCERTPCRVLLPHGRHMLRFTGVVDDGRSSTTWVTNIEPRAAVNHTLGQHRSSSLATVIGGTMIVAGIAAIVFPFGLDMDRKEPTPKVLWAAGIAGIFGGVTVMSFMPATSQDGATAVENGPPKLPPQPPMQSKGVSLRWEF